MHKLKPLPLHGGEAQAIAAKLGIEPKDLLDFSSNTFFCATILSKEIANTIKVDLEHYPDPELLKLRSALAAYEAVGIENILPSNGSTELISSIFLALKVRRVLFVGPVFSEYLRLCELFSIEYHCYTPSLENAFECTTDDIKALSSLEADLTIVCSPNNPAGAVYQNLEALLACFKSKQVLWDATYKDFLYGQESFSLHQACLKNAIKSDKLICLCSLTKFYACPGLRLGYALASAKLIKLIKPFQSAWSVGAHAIEIGQELLANKEQYRAKLPLLHQAKIEMRELLLSTKLFDCCLEGVSFLTLRVKKANTGRILREKMLEQQILIRSCDNILGMPLDFIRLQVREASEVRHFIKILEQLNI